LRLARSRTGRDHFLSVGYHGYQDWFALAWPKPGIPQVLGDYVHEVAYGDRAAVDRVFAEHGDKLAAALVVPIEWHLEPDPGFLAHLRGQCDAHGTALVFDEILTGFRLAPGGAAEHFGVTPDMAAYAKGIANGYPLSAYAGKREWMETLGQTIITTTYAGETLSLAAACAAMEIYRREPVQAHLARLGRSLREGFEKIFRETGLPARTVGVDPGAVIDFSPAGDVAESLHQRLFNRLYELGIFANEQWFITYSHQPADIEATLEAMRHAIRDTL
ncbi:MAG: aminotransferase class III-fold pyridoxal phosphate-dependent enzyme, partial [Opitutales bacterium]